LAGEDDLPLIPQASSDSDGSKRLDRQAPGAANFNSIGFGSGEESRENDDDNVGLTTAALEALEAQQDSNEYAEELEELKSDHSIDESIGGSQYS